MAYRQQQSFDGSTHELNHGGGGQHNYVDQGGYDQGYSDGPSRVRGGAGKSMSPIWTREEGGSGKGGCMRAMRGMGEAGWRGGEGRAALGVTD